MNIASEKNELIKWVNSIENSFIIEELNKIRKRENFDSGKSRNGGLRRKKIKNVSQISLKHYLGKKTVQYPSEIAEYLKESAALLFQKDFLA
ncbi:hypothetical protein FY557_10315 [Chryseobacterium sp. SN22]|uniref:hypothetical protein n=1 Tax=Chryseobacterium sp. SN22 TaxID=2606431 RepID=UPI0011EFEF7A|nr:hypothetical protein [Chryseobacterium sp. SN22]KAA0128103.1 hypothetical protein FY557_10315 [Chryseobacterium sp. SN22]